MRIFRQIFVIGMLLLAVATASEVELRDGDKLSGEFLKLDEEGTITMRSPISEKELRLDGSRVVRIEFGNRGSIVEVPEQRIRLLNGDVIPASIEQMDEDELRLASPFFGELVVPRSVVDSVQLGIVPEKAVIDGLGGSEKWILGGGGESNWKLQDGVMSSSGVGVAARKLDLPEKYIIRYDLRWAGQPNFRMLLGDEMLPSREKTNRYILQFGVSGLSVKRELADGGREVSIALSNRRPEMYSDNRMNLELRVDGSSGKIHLYIDGNLEGRFRDSFEDLPKGDGISFVSHAQGSSKHHVSNLEITEWDDRGERHRSEERGDGDEDSMIGRNGERISGRLIAVVDGEGGKVFRFKSDYQNEPLDLPEAEVSTVFFARSGTTDAYDSAEGMIMHVSGDGQLAVKSCELEEYNIAMVHPFLGKIIVKRDVVSKMERRKIPKAKQVKKQ